MQKSFVVFLLFCFLRIESLWAQDFQDSNMPSNIALSGGLRSDTITSTKGNYAGTTIGYNRNPSLSISGAAGSQYALQVQDNTTTWYSGGLSVGNDVQAGIVGIHTFSVERNSVSVGQGGTLSIISSGNSINAQGSDYGGDSKIHFGVNTSLNLNRSSSATFSNSLFFIHNGSVTLLQDSKLSIESKVIRIQSSLENNSGEITLNGKVQNIGRNISYGNNTASNFTNNAGNITINGDFYNGGQADTDTSGSVAGGFNTYDPGFGGGGNLTINGGNVTISGKLISTHGGDMFQNDTQVYNPINSSITINGGTLRVNGGVTNAQGSSLTFGFLNGKMGELIGNLDSTNGSVVVNMAGADEGNYTLIQGNVTGLTQGQNFSIINGNNEFSTTTFNPNTWQVTINTNKNAIDSFTNTLDSNRSAILDALNVQYGNIFTMQDSVTLRNTTQNIMSGIYSNYIATPISILDSIKTNMLNEALRQNLNSRAGWHIGVSGLGLGLVGAGVGVGGIGGVNIGAHNVIQSHTLSFQLGYAFSSSEYGNLKALQSSESVRSGSFSTSHNLALSAFDRIIFGYNRSFELDLGGYFLMSFMNARRQISGVDSANSDVYVARVQGNFTQIALDSSVGYRFNFANVSLKPYVGVTNAVLMLGNFKENADSKALSASVKTQGLYALNILTGLENRVHLRDNSIVLLFGFHYENQILSSNEIVVGVDSATLRFNLPYKHRISLNYGGNFVMTENMSAGISAFYKIAFGGDAYNPNLDFSSAANYFGLDVAFSYRF